MATDREHDHQCGDLPDGFLIQNTQNRDSTAAKLDELIRVSGAQNTYIGIEHLTEDEIDEIRAKCEARLNRGRPLRIKELGGAQDAAAEVCRRPCRALA